MLSDNEQLQFILSAVCVAIVGGIANWLMSDDHTIFQFIVAIFLAGFAGFLVGELCIEAHISESVAFFFCGSAGLCAELILKIARKTIIKKIGVLTDQKLDDELNLIEEEYKVKKAEIVRRKKQAELKENNLDDFM